MAIVATVSAAEITPDPHPLMILPFAAMLLAIALAPLVLKHHWERHYHNLAMILGAICVLYYLLVLRAPHELRHTAREYVSFMALIGSLFVVTGGIHLDVKGSAKPWGNCVYLFSGAVLANVIGTTGASMLLVRPWIRMNKYRFTGLHTAFFIFAVSNIGGCLTPIGDPPLFLGFLKGVPFWWVVRNCWPAWCVAMALLLTVFYFVDRHNFRRAPRGISEAETRSETWKVGGLHNLGFIALILAAVFIRGPAGARECLMVVAAAGSYFTTSRRIHDSNDFSFAPIKEVAWLFLGIFATMIPALNYLQLHGGELGIRTPANFFWMSGALSAVLDNAPTYLAFLATAFGLHGLHLESAEQVRQFVENHRTYLLAISLGSVFFGAITYIGNGPNLLVKAVADQAKVHTPSFPGYVLKFSLPVLLPIFVVISLLFFPETNQRSTRLSVFSKQARGTSEISFPIHTTNP